MSLMISIEQIHDDYGMPTWRGTCTTGVVAGVAVLGADARDPRIAVTGAASSAFTARKATPVTPAWRPPTS